MKKLGRLLLVITLIAFLGTTAAVAQNSSGKVNINTASAEQLTELPGIGDATAEKILEYREKIGNFKTPDQLMEVKGIGEKTFEELEGMITL